MIAIQVARRPQGGAGVYMHEVDGATLLTGTKGLVIDDIPVLQGAVDEEAGLRQFLCL